MEIITVLGLVLTVAGFVYVVRRDRREAEKWHDERKPVLRAGVEGVNRESPWWRLWVELDSPDPLSSLDVEIVRGDGLVFTRGQQGVVPASPAVRAAWRETLQPGNRAVWRVDPEQGVPLEVRLVVRCRRGSRQWTVLVPAELPRRQGRLIV